MKILSRDFTLREKISITILLIIVICFGYKTLVHDPIEEQLVIAEGNRQTLETEIMIINSKINNLQKMQEELDQILNDPTVTVMPSYNNVKEELAFLNETLTKSYSYSINVDDVTKDGNQIRRDVAIQFTAKDFNSMKDIIKTLSENKERSLISNIQFSNNNGISCSLLVTFYETMVGGTADTGLPIEK